MSLGTPQNITDIRLNFGFYLARPQDIFPENISPGVDTEIYEETPGVFGGVVYDEGASGDSGNVKVEE